MRQLILKALKDKGQVSGEQLGKQLNISRTAVWKHIHELRKKGYQIESSPRSGYSFIGSSDLIVPEELTSDLDTKFMGKRIVYYEEVTSTQEMAEKLARNGAVEGTVAIAEQQTGGRGRKGRIWTSPPQGGIYMSFILRPNLRPAYVIQIPLIAGVALAKTIQKILPLHANIKWPNDIYIGNKKVAGILTEMNSELDKVNYIILGIGINVNTQLDSLQEEVRSKTTSLVAEYGQSVSRASIIRQFFIEFERIYHRFLISGFSTIRHQWKMLTNTLGYRVKVYDDTTEIFGTALDIDEEGFLLIKKDDGTIEKIISGDVSLVKQEFAEPDLK
jgi:BirA family biotin operon repressor/biotin-[acetyl-CoA-carboxylase] ligase